MSLGDHVPDDILPSSFFICKLRRDRSILRILQTPLTTANTQPPEMDASILFNLQTHSHLIPHLVALHKTCTLSPPYFIGEFLPPLNEPLMLSYWTDLCAETERGLRIIFLQLAKAKSGSGEEEVVGVATLATPFSQTAAFRGNIEKLLVAPEWRGKGIARSLVKKVEQVAKERGRGLLTICAEEGAPGSVIYPKWGYTYMGTLPKSETSPLDGSLKDGIYFYKDLREL